MIYTNGYVWNEELFDYIEQFDLPEWVETIEEFVDYQLMMIGV